MMGKIQLVILCVALADISVPILGLDDARNMDMEQIKVNNPYVSEDHDGKWGPEEHCPQGHAFAFEMKYEDENSADWTAVNAVKLFCRDANGDLTGEIVSFEGKYGSYQGVRSCGGGDDMMTGFRLRVWPYQGTFGDDWAVDNVEIACKSGLVLNGLGDNYYEKEAATTNKKLPTMSISENMEMIRIPVGSNRDLLHGDWTQWANCSQGYYICGLTTLVEQGHPLSDDAGLIDMYMFCSNL